MLKQDKKLTLVALILGALVLLSFTLGLVAYLPAENRAKKIEETLEKHKTKSERSKSSTGSTSIRPRTGKAQPWSG